MYTDRKRHPLTILIACLLLAVLLAGAARLFGARAAADISDETAHAIRDAVLSRAAECYAVEGAYPEDLSTLRKNYGLAYDENRYFVSYDAFASNQFPEIMVTEAEVEEE